MRHNRLIVWLVFATALTAPPSFASENGASDERVSLPEGPGSLGGTGENVSVNGAMGSMSWSVPIETPQGHPEATPSVSISYSSGAGQSIVGMGWSMEMPSIERMTRFGLPTYTTDDRFAVGGGTELVHVSTDGDARVYRARFEGGFVRYTWQSAGSGQEGYWKVESPNGAIASYGATLDGTIVDASRFKGQNGTFRYHLVEEQDVHGNTVRYDYSMYGPGNNVPLLDRIGYGYTSVFPPQDAVPRFEIVFFYEERQDQISDGKSGALEVLDQRLAKLFVRSDDRPVRTYEMVYEPYNQSGGFTRLHAVDHLGRDGGLNPIRFQFSYSQVLGSLCDSADCTQPFLQSMGTIPGGANLANSRTTLIDINGDSLPDVLHTPLDGPHQFHLNQRDVDGLLSFGAAQESQLGADTEGKQLGSQAQPLDVDGDGFCDLLVRKNGTYFKNNGTGDWDAELPIGDPDTFDSSLPNFDSDFNIEENGFETIRFMDIDNDKRIDLLQTPDPNTALVFTNNGTFGFTQNTIDALGASFASDTLDLADMNGDGLLDIVERASNLMRYRLNLGFGNFTGWVVVDNAPFVEAATVGSSILQDINGDGLDDVVLVVGAQVEFALNDAAGGFLPIVTITEALGADGSTAALPTVDATSGGLQYADMNGNGSTDIVWIDNNGAVTFLDLFPLRPNLLTRIDNGVGLVIDVQYSTTVEQRVTDTANGDYGWSHPTPTATQVVSATDTWDRATGLHDIMTYRYHSGYYSKSEKLFRGFESVESFSEAENMEPRRDETTYDHGAPTADAPEDPYRQSEAIVSRTYGGWIMGPQGALDPPQDGAETPWRLLRTIEKTYEDCPLEGIADDLEPPVRFRCITTTRTIEQEGAPEDEWVTMETQSQYDGYGNATRVANLGITRIGTGGCEPCGGNISPCGPQCEGDEVYQEANYVPPLAGTAGRWMVGYLERFVQRTEENGEATSEVLFRYDGEDFIGLEAGQLSRGLLSRTLERQSNDGDDFVERSRQRHDQWGNGIERLDDRVSLENPEYRQAWEFGPHGLVVTRALSYLKDDIGAYTLQTEFEYDRDFDVISAISRPRVFRDGETDSALVQSFYTYDEFKRMKSQTRYGGSTEAPTTTFKYEFANESSGWFTRIVIQTRSQKDGAQDQERYKCYNGRGGFIEERIRTSPTMMAVSGRLYLTPNGNKVRMYQSSEEDNAQCTMSSPNASATEFYHDALMREVRSVQPPNESGGTPPETRTRYAPRMITAWDTEDLNEKSPFYDTPTTSILDGRGNVNRIIRRKDLEGTVTDYLITDDTGNITTHIAPDGTTREQSYDLLGRLVSTSDPARGTTSIEYDEANNPIRHTNANGDVWRSSYDGAGRLLRSWDESNESSTLVEYRYDAQPDCPNDQCTHLAGTMASVSYPLSDTSRQTRWFGYDERGFTRWLAQEHNGVLLETTSTYDEIGNVVEANYPAGIKLTLERDQAGRLRSIPGVIESLTYNDKGLIASLEYANGTKTEWGYNNRLLPNALTTVTADGHSVIALTADRDQSGRIVGLVDGTESNGPGHSANFSYDIFGRLATAHLNPDRSPFEESISYSYALSGALQSVTSTRDTSPRNLGEYRYEGTSLHAVTNIAGEPRTYDAGGQLTVRGQEQYQWDSRGRLQIISRNNVETARMFYGAGYQRIARRSGNHFDWFFNDIEVRDGVISVQVQLEGIQIARIESASLSQALTLDSSSADNAPPSAKDAWLTQRDRLVPNDLLTPTTRHILSASARAAAVGTDTKTTFLHQDMRANVVAATDSEGTVTEAHVFYPFGATVDSTDVGSHDLRYSGKELERASRLTYYGTRYLDTETGRWISPDTAYRSLTQGQLHLLNDATDPYGYVENDPINSFDQTGREPTAITTLIGSGAWLGAIAGGYTEMKAQSIVQAKRLKSIAELQRKGSANRTERDEKRLKNLLKNKVDKEYDNVGTAISVVTGATTGALTLGLGIPGMMAGKYAGAKVRTLFANPDSIKAQVAGAVAGFLVSAPLTGGMSVVGNLVGLGTELAKFSIDTGIQFAQVLGEHPFVQGTFNVAIKSITNVATNLVGRIGEGIYKLRSAYRQKKRRRLARRLRVSASALR